jgi:hypothetical protein
MASGITLTITHTGSVNGSLLLDDLYDGTDYRSGQLRPGAVYVPESGSITIVYSSSVADSLENGSIRAWIDAGYLTVAFNFGTEITRDMAATSNGLAAYTVTDTTYTVGDTIDVVLVNQSSAAAVAITLPAGDDHHTGVVYIKDKRGSANTYNITITADGSETIDGAASAQISIDYGALKLFWQGTEWSIL